MFLPSSWQWVWASQLAQEGFASSRRTARRQVGRHDFAAAVWPCIKGSWALERSTPPHVPAVLNKTANWLGCKAKLGRSGVSDRTISWERGNLFGFRCPGIKARNLWDCASGKVRLACPSASAVLAKTGGGEGRGGSLSHAFARPKEVDHRH